MKIKNWIISYAMICITAGTSHFIHCTEKEASSYEKKFFNKYINSSEQNKKQFKEKVESKVADIIDGKTNYPRIIKNFIKTYQEDIKEILLWINENYHDKDACEYRDDREALNKLSEDVTRISKANQLPSQRSQAVYLCNYDHTSACKNLAYAYDSFQFQSQGMTAIRNIESLNHQIYINHDDKHTVAFLEKAKKRLEEDLKKINTPLFNSIKNSGNQYSLSNSPSYFESLSEENKKALTDIIENVVCEKITNFDNLAEEFQKIFYVFHEKAARKHLNEKEALKELREDITKTQHQKSNYYTYSSTVHDCELEWSDEKTSECKRLTQAYINLRSHSNMHEIKKINSLQNQINAKSSLFFSSNNDPVITFLKKEKEQLEQEVKNNNNGNIPTNIPSYYSSLAEKDQKELIAIIENVVRKKVKNLDGYGNEFQKIFEIFDEKL